MASAMQILKDLAVRRLLESCPDHPYPGESVHKYKDSTANGLTRCIIDFVTMMGGQAERISTTGRPIDKRTTYKDVLGHTKQIGTITWIPGTVTSGSSDISAIVRTKSGKVISWKIEVKMKDKQSAKQKAYQKQVESAGGVYSIFRSFQDFYDAYQGMVSDT